jgi:predicted O-methyltransferase YrrM
VAETPPELMRLVALMHGFRSTQAIYVFAKLRLADYLADSPLTAAELASTVDADPASLGRVLRLAAYYGVVNELPEGRFGLTPFGQPLRSDVKDSIAPTAIMLGQEHYRAWGSLLHSVRSGESAFQHVYGLPMFDYLAKHPDAQADFDAAMGSGTDVFLRSLAAVYDFSESRVIVDVGGGNGSVSAVILKQNPSLEAVIYDQPQVLEAADRYLSAAGVRSRCRLVAGDFFSSVPDDGDIYMLSNIVHDWDDERAVRILRNCRTSMKPGAAVLLLEAVLPEHGRPSPATMFDVNMMVMLTGRERTEAQFRSLLGGAELRLTKVVAISDRLSLIEARPH